MKRKRKGRSKRTRKPPAIRKRGGADGVEITTEVTPGHLANIIHEALKKWVLQPDLFAEKFPRTAISPFGFTTQTI